MKRYDFAAILAGGLSTRMEYDKQLIKVGSEYLLDLLHRELQRHFKRVLIVTNTPQLYMQRGYETTGDIVPFKGPLGGIHTALEYFGEGSVYITACDMPNISHGYIDYLHEVFENSGKDGVVSMSGEHLEPMHAIYSCSLSKEIEKRMASESLGVSSLIRDMDFVKLPTGSILNFTPHWRLFSSINTKSQLDEICRLRRKGAFL